MKKLVDDLKNIIIGYSGHAYGVIEAAMHTRNCFTGYCDLNEAKANPYALNFEGLETKEVLDANNWFIGIGDNLKREKLYYQFKDCGQLINVLSRSAHISSSATLSKGIFVGPNTIVHSLAKIGIGVIINSGSIVEHECTIGAFSHIAPGAVLLGDVTIGKRCLIGANAAIKPGVSICDDVIIGMGAVVTQDINKPGVYIGSPAILKP
ncbi:acetyltransferase [Robertkochia flava]|uniref:acetyltransferase n=1 Tax=Robertkochia flava TaxID=3447986 RepID=UPI001CCFE8A4|nr:acetyltransferase [Robertkochia marina]